jgi:sugar/nucleoside kinase (ribokinase family)
MWDILGIGCVAVDELLYVSDFPAPDTKVRVNRRERSCGGLTGNALVAAARLGARCAFAGSLGDDDDSRFVRDAFEREGIDLSALVVTPGVRPIHSTILVDESRHTRTILFDLTGTACPSLDFPPAEVIVSPKVLLVDHFGIEGMTRAARTAREAGVAVVGDLERDEWPGFHDLLALVDHVIVSCPLALKVTGAQTAEDAATRLWTESRQAVVVTCGEDGCLYCDGDQAGHQPAFPVQAADTTGCGDVFHGAYAAALSQGMPMAARIRHASAAAAIKATRTGGQAGFPTRQELASFLQSH